jgi:hypothetical protein
MSQTAPVQRTNVVHRHVARPGESLPSGSFEVLARKVARESSVVLPASPHALKQSYEEGLAVVAIDTTRNDEPVGYVRLQPLLTADIRSALGVGDEFPHVMELGTMIMDTRDEYRGGKYMPLMTRDLLHYCREDIVEGRLIVLGTTKNWQVMKILQGIADLDFRAYNHHAMAHIAALTCTCSGDFGLGYQVDPQGCPKRIPSNSGASLEDLRAPIQRADFSGCVMFVSKPSKTLEADEQLREAVVRKGANPDHSVIAVRNALLGGGYYGQAGHFVSPQATHFIPVETLLTSARR